LKKEPRHPNSKKTSRKPKSKKKNPEFPNNQKRCNQEMDVPDVNFDGLQPHDERNPSYEFFDFL
jgi:hypothetical protein